MIGKVLFEYDNLPSTNELALEIAAKGTIQEGAVVQTHNQTKGRGQMGTTWHSNPGENLTLSIVLRPEFLSIRHQFYLNKAVSLAVIRTVEKFINDTVHVKWPNDIYVDKEKTCGILIQNSIQKQTISHSIIGIGLNVNQIEFPSDLPNATSLRKKGGQTYDLEEVRNQLFKEMDLVYSALRADLHFADDQYKRRLYRRNLRTIFHNRGGLKFEGIIQDVNLSGQILIRNVDGKVNAYSFKEISYT